MKDSFLAVLMKIGQPKRTRSGEIVSKRKPWVLMMTLGVVVIVGGIIVSNLFDKAKQRTACLQLLTINDAIELFTMENHQLPDDLQALRNADNPSEKIYLNWKPIDPWRNPYVYHVNAVSGYNLMSLGADGVQGGDGEAKDISIEDAKAEIQERDK